MSKNKGVPDQKEQLQSIEPASSEKLARPLMRVKIEQQPKAQKRKQPTPARANAKVAVKAAALDRPLSHVKLEQRSLLPQKQNNPSMWR